MGGQVRVIHCKRDFRDIAISVYLENFRRGGALLWTFDLQSIRAFFEEYMELMGHLRMVLPPSTFAEVGYEDLVGDFDGNLRSLSQFLGLEWDDTTAALARKFHLLDREVLTASRDQVRQPLYSKAVGRWRHIQDAEFQQLFQD